MVEVGDGERELAQHAVGAVDEGQPLLLGEDDRGEAVFGEGVGGTRQPSVGGTDSALTGHRERDVCERRQITRATEAAELVDHRRDPRRQQVGVRLRHLGPHTRASRGERGQAQQHQRTDDLALHLGTGSRRVRADQAALQLGSHLLRDVPGGERAEAGRHAVHRAGVGGEVLDARPRARDLGEGVVGEADPVAAACDVDDVLDRDGSEADLDEIGGLGGERHGGLRRKGTARRTRRP